MKKVLSVLLVFLMFFGTIPSVCKAENTSGDVVIFGSYEQDNNPANGKEPIEWQVLDIQDGNAFLISKYALDCQLYHSTLNDITWEKSSLRSWLNKEFLKNAFTTDEQDQILITTVLADKNPRNSTDPGNITNDKIFILSIAEVSRYFSSDSARLCNPTAYAVAQGCDNNYSDDHNCAWWLRSPSYAQFLADWVSEEGQLNVEGVWVSSEGIGIRPALWIPSDSLVFARDTYDKLFCSQCGKQIPVESNYCSYCGHKVWKP